MKKLGNFVEKYKWILFALVTAAILFYWYEWRPAQIEKECAAVAVRLGINGASYRDTEEVQKLCVDAGGADKLYDIVDDKK